MRDSRISFSSLGFALSPKALTLAPGLEASVFLTCTVVNWKMVGQERPRVRDGVRSQVQSKGSKSSYSFCALPLMRLKV